MKLYNIVGSCALAPQIALETARAKYELIRIERGRNLDPADLSINLLGLVPALIDDAGTLITENTAVLLRIAEGSRMQDWRRRWEPPSGIRCCAGSATWRARSTPRTGCSGARSASRPSPNTSRASGAAEACLEQAHDVIDWHLVGRPCLTGERFTAADAYLSSKAPASGPR